jgi:hypothetical protein
MGTALVAAKASLRDNALSMLWGLLLVSLSFLLHLNYLPYAEDDAYIHMRIARHLWMTGYPYFNHGEPVMGSTAPLWLLITGPGAIAGDFQPLAVACLNIFVLTSAAWIWGLVFARLIRSEAHMPHGGALVVTFLTLAPSSISLMETPLAMMLTGLGYLGALNRQWWSIPAIALVPFVRPECAVFAIAIFVYRLYSKQTWSLLEVAATALPVSLLIAFDLHFFGSVIPHTARAKDIVYEISTHEFVRFFCFGSYGAAIARGILPFSLSAAGITLITLILSFKREQSGSIFHEPLRAIPPITFVLAPAGVILLLYAVKHVLVFPWYTPLILVPAHLGCLYLVHYRTLSVKLLGASLLLPLCCVGLLLSGGLQNPEVSPFFESGARARQLRLLGTALYRAFPGARLMAPEIGALGFSFRGRIIDSIGLISPQALEYHPLQIPRQRPAGFLGSVPRDLVVNERPELIVGLSTLVTDLSEPDPIEDYDIIKRSPMSAEDLARGDNGTVFGAREILIFRRKDLMSPEGRDILTTVN